ncbi:phytoene desaturase family protein [Microbacterium kyungheense]|uniref:Phytoene dehydrogenase-like protein n=1 Tax=Microbacterium kyungheense TaxID=1263636 RepID=A0A543EDZ0_9MICO|nr:NAD(P)/FAD-dependent oxidoreductase [Microbacterium kyungheense]TQM19818.1 phytoene dehydrogenase-like protein [Microbacterium kyungheense]
MHSAPSRDVDVAIVGGGHNALVAAAYLARAGHRVIVLERLSHVGGAAVSERPWAGVDARLSRYSYLVSLLPRRIVDDLGLDIRLLRRRISSYTPEPADPRRGLLIDTADAGATADSFVRATGDAREAERFAGFYERLAPLARAVFPTLTDPLPRADDLRAAVADDGLWSAIVDQPLGAHVRASLRTDLARGVVLTDALIGTFAAADDPSLRQNRCFLYHVIGGGTGDWDVPVGGMGQVSGALRTAALRAGAELATDAEVTALSPDGEVVIGDGERVVHARLVLSGVGEAVLARLLDAGGAAAPDGPAVAPEGAQLKVNMLLARLPRLRDTAVDAATAFAGTFHINETMTQLDRAYDDAAVGRVPAPLPAEVYCHSLTDPSILGDDLRASGAQTLTLFGLQVPHRLLEGTDPDERRAELLAAAEASLGSVLAEPLRDVLFHTPDGQPCVEARTTLDLEHSLGMAGGDIFHGGLDWPWADDEVLDSPARRWGVATPHERILMCGSSARRGGAVSGIGGHNAAMATLELLGR